MTKTVDSRIPGTPGFAKVTAVVGACSLSLMTALNTRSEVSTRQGVAFVPWLLVIMLVMLWPGVLLAAPEKGPCGSDYDTEVRFPYAIHATWMFARDTGCDWQQAMEGFHRIGGKAVLQFGSTLEKLEKNAGGLVRVGELVPVLENCRHADGSSCVEQAEQDLAEQGIGRDRIANWLAYDSFESHSDAILCPGSNSLDRRLETTVNGKRQTVWRIVLQHDDASQGCHFQSGMVDVLFVVQQPAAGAQEQLMEVADALGMEVYLGAPSFPVEAGAEWKPDYSLAPALLDWSRRVFKDLERRYGDHPSFHGVYQTFEVPLMTAWQGDGYDLYARQAQLLHTTTAGGKYVVSPYLFVNKSQGGTTISGTVEGYKRLVRAGVDIISPQDGRGTGKAALFWPWEKNQNVSVIDPQLGNYTNVDGGVSFEAQFHGSTAELFRALRTAVVAMAEHENINAELWPNIEAFEEDRDASDFVGCAYSDLSQTTKARIDHAITSAGPAQRVASFMFDPLFNCSNRHGTSLMANIITDYDRPIVVDVEVVPDQNGSLVVRGYHLAANNTHFELEWHDDLTSLRLVTADVVQSERSSEQGLDRVWLRVNKAQIPAGRRFNVIAETDDGRRTYAAYGLATNLITLAQIDEKVLN